MLKNFSNYHGADNGTEWHIGGSPDWVSKAGTWVGSNGGILEISVLIGSRTDFSDYHYPSNLGHVETHVCGWITQEINTQGIFLQAPYYFNYKATVNGSR